MGEKMDWNDNQMTRPSYAINDDMELESSEASQHSDDNCAKKIYATEFPAWVLKRLNATKKSKPSNLLLQMNGENLTVLFSWVDKSFAIVLNNENTRRRPKDLDSGLVPRDPIYDSLRTKMINLPRNMWFGRIVIDATTNGELEDTFVESLVMKKWICQTFELNISAKFTRSALVARLIRTLNPAEITINLQSGSFFSSQNSGEKFGENERMANGHVHVLVHRDNLATFEPDAIELMKTMVKNDLKMTRNGDTCGSEAATSYSIELGHALKYGREMLQTLLAIQQLFKSIVEMAINSGCRGRFSLKKLIIRGPMNDFDCTKYSTCSKDQKRQMGEGDLKTIAVCARTAHSRPIPCLTFPLGLMRLPLDNSNLLELTKRITNFQCTIPMRINRELLRLFITDWTLGTRDVDELHVDVNEASSNFLLPLFEFDESDPKWLKLRRESGRRTTLYVIRKAVNGRILVVRTVTSSKVNST